jgi:hypothetical protein
VKALRKNERQDETQLRKNERQDETQLRKNERQDETQFATKIDGFLSFIPC